MATYSSSDWVRLGQAVHEARKEAGLGKTREWASAVGRSDRTLLELERGGTVGTTTLEAIEDALEWPRGGAYRVLGGLEWRSLKSTPANPLPDYGGPTWSADADDPWVAGQVELKNYIDGSIGAFEEDHLALEERVRKLEKALRAITDGTKGGDGNVQRLPAPMKEADELSAPSDGLQVAAKTGELEEPGEDSI